MGLDFSHGDAHWSYGGFSRFRSALAELEGIDLANMSGFTTGGRSWDETTTTLRPLLDHSDCDGELSPAECAALLPRLQEIHAQWDAADNREAGRLGLLIKGMQMCVDQDEPLEFC